MDTMFSRGVLSLKPATKIFSKRQLLSFFAAAAAAVVVVVGWNPAEERGCTCTASKWSWGYTNGELRTA